jgi:predicted Zn-dependent protease
VLLLSGAFAWGYALLGSKWSSSRVVMYLQLGSSGGALMDGAASWDASAEDALATWNTYLQGMQFTVVRDSVRNPGDGDNINNVFFSSTIYGMSFTDAVAVTTEWTVGSERVEADTVFNTALDWNSYRGPLRDASGGGVLYDLRRVALHEFGHTLGLDHPDEQGQTVAAIMNSRVSDVDDLLPDDIRGGQALYGARTRALGAFTNPRASSVQTTAPSYLFRGTADPSRVSKVRLVNTRLGSRRYFKASGISRWRRSIALKPGINVIRLYVDTAAGRKKVAQRRVVRNSN